MTLDLKLGYKVVGSNAGSAIMFALVFAFFRILVMVVNLDWLSPPRSLNGYLPELVITIKVFLRYIITLGCLPGLGCCELDVWAPQV